MYLKQMIERYILNYLQTKSVDFNFRQMHYPKIKQSEIFKSEIFTVQYKQS